MKYSPYYIFLFLFLFAIISCNSNSNGEKSSFVAENDSTLILIKTSKNDGLSRKKRFYFINRAYNYARSISNDSIRNLSLLNVSLEFYKLKDSFSFREVNKKSTNLSYKLKDSSSYAANFWDLGNFSFPTRY